MAEAEVALPPLQELAEHRDDLADGLAQALAVSSPIADEHASIDNDLADGNHGGVAESVSRVVGYLDSLTDDALGELTQLAAIVIPGHPNPHQVSRYPAGPIPAHPDVVDPASVKRRDPVGDETEDDVEAEYDDDLTEAHRSLVLDRSTHVLSLVRHAADLAHTIVDHAHAGDAEGTRRLLAQRDEIVAALGQAFLLWGYALAGQMSGPEGPSEHISDVTRWLDDTTRSQ